MILRKSAPHPGKWRRWLTILQALISLGLVVWLIQRESWQSLLQTLWQASPAYMVLACCAYYVGVVVNCYKWQLALAIESLSIPLLRLVRWYLIGALASNVLPTSIGGDVVRGYYAIRSMGQGVTISRTILVERLSGLLIMMLLAWFGLMVITHQSLLALVILLVTITGLISGVVGMKYLDRLPGRLDLVRQKIRAVIALYFLQPRKITMIIFLSCVFQLLAGLGVWCNLRAVDIAIPFLEILLISSIVSVAGILPISLNGWGVSESLFLILLAPLHVSGNDILAGLLLGRVLLLIVSLAGAVPLFLELCRPQSPDLFDREYLG